jgi:hypothetical protein
VALRGIHRGFDELLLTGAGLTDVSAHGRALGHKMRLR